MSTESTSSTQGVVAIERVFDAPRSLVFEAWTQPERFMHWWGPRGFTTPFCSIDLRRGGVNHSCMRSPEGKDFWSKGIYKEVIEPEKLVVTDSFADAEGNVVPALYYGMTGEWPLEMLVTVIFEEMDGQTKLNLWHVGLPPGENTEMCAAGWNESLDKLDEYLAEESD